MEIIQYTLITLTTIAGLFLGALISWLATDERQLSKKYLALAVLPITPEITYAILGIIFALFSDSAFFSITASIIFLYNIPTGSNIFVEKKQNKLVTTSGTFILCAFVTKLVTTFLF